MRNDLPALVNAFHKNASVHRIGIPTNGLLTSRVAEFTKEILTSSPDIQLNIVLSVDGFEQTHDLIRGIKGSFRKTLLTLENLKSLRSRYSNLSINICSVLNNLNANELPELLEFMKGLGVDFHDIGIMRGDYPDKSLSLPSTEKMSEIFKITERYHRDYYLGNSNYSTLLKYMALKVRSSLNKMFLKFRSSDDGGVPANRTEGDVLEDLSDGSRCQKCLIGDAFAVIEPNGDVRLCEQTPVVGNLLPFDANFKSFWLNSDMKKIRKNALCPEKYCTHSNFQTRNFLLNPLNWWKALI